MNEKNQTTKSRFRVSFQSYSLLLTCAIIAAGMTYILYKQTQVILEDRLKERLISVVSTASLLFEPSELNQIIDADSVKNPIYIRTVKKLQMIRERNNNLIYAYILRPTENPDIFEYIADADSEDPFAKVDLNEDGVINEEDSLAVPGDEYDVSEIPALRNESLISAVTDSAPVSDQWGSFLSAYVPIKENEKVVGILGIDVEVSDYLMLIRRTLVPFATFVLFLLGMLTIMTVTLVKVWNRQVHIMAELDRQKDELISIVSHQLATPVSSVKWYLEMMLDGDIGKLTEEQATHVKTLQSVVSDLADLVSMILDVSRIQLGKMRVDKAQVNLVSFFNEILAVIKPKAEQRPVELHVSLPKELPTAMLDKRLLRITLENLLSNAVKYTPEKGSVYLDVVIKDQKLMYTVKDTGYGIPVSEQDKIFGKLFRASNVQKIDGNGFGLFAAKGAVEAQKGTIRFESKEGQGTTFYVELPLS